MRLVTIQMSCGRAPSKDRCNIFCRFRSLVLKLSYRDVQVASWQNELLLLLRLAMQKPELSVPEHSCFSIEAYSLWYCVAGENKQTARFLPNTSPSPLRSRRTPGRIYSPLTEGAWFPGTNVAFDVSLSQPRVLPRPRERMTPQLTAPWTFEAHLLYGVL